MTFVATLHIYGIASRNFISISMCFRCICRAFFRQRNDMLASCMSRGTRLSRRTMRRALKQFDETRAPLSAKSVNNFLRFVSVLCCGPSCSLCRCFLLHDAMHSTVFPSCGVCLSVSLFLLHSFVNVFWFPAAARCHI